MTANTVVQLSPDERKQMAADAVDFIKDLLNIIRDCDKGDGVPLGPMYAAFSQAQKPIEEFRFFLSIGEKAGVIRTTSELAFWIGPR